MTPFLFNIGLALIWAALTGSFSPANLAVGFALGYLVLFLAQRALGTSAYSRKAQQVIGFCLFFLWALIVANLRVAYDVLTPRHHMRPRVIAIPLDAASDTQITLLANLISLTPGTLSLDVSTDRKSLYIHVMYAADADGVRREIKSGLERWVLALFSSDRG